MPKAINLTKYVHKVMLDNQIHIGVYEHHFLFKGSMKLNGNVLVFTNFYAMVMFQFA